MAEVHHEDFDADWSLAVIVHEVESETVMLFGLTHSAARDRLKAIEAIFALQFKRS